MIDGDAYILVPTAITGSELTSSTIADPDTGEVAWNAATAYNVDDVVYLASNHTLYTRRVAGTTATSPDADTTNWAASGRQNRWGMFDDTSGTLSQDTDGVLTVVLRPGRVGGLFADGVEGWTFDVSMKDQPGGTVVYTASINLDDTIYTSVYDWLVMDREQKTTIALVDLPTQFFDPEITVTIDAGAGVAKCDALRVGPVYNIGATLIGASVSFLNYSRVTTDDYGVTSITARGFLKRLTCKVKASRNTLKRLVRLLTTLKDTLAVYIPTSIDEDLTPMCVQGIPEDCSIDTEDGDVVQANLQIKGISLS